MLQTVDEADSLDDFRDVFGSIEGLHLFSEGLAQPLIYVVRERDEHWPLLRSLVAESGTAGNLTTDAHLAALAIHQGAVLVSCADFARFAGLR